MPQDRPIFHITHLYPEQMSIYGDMGNIHALNYRLQKYGFKVKYQILNPGEDLPKKTDVYFIGGGQDQEQFLIFKDLIRKKDKLFADLENGVPLLAICGGYQLFGEKFVTGEGLEIDGLGWFEVETKAPDSKVTSRCIGNLIVESQIPDLQGVKLVGFENHGGQTRFTSDENSRPIGKVLYGFGNNSDKVDEGCVRKNAVGTYMHGSCLPKNPELADFLIFQSLRRLAEKGELDPKTYIEIRKIKIDDTIALRAKKEIIDRFLKVKK